MKKKNLLFVAAAMVMAGCASDDMIGDNNATQSENQVIAFNMNVPATTRATNLDRANSATKLNKRFIVWGEKNENDGTAASATTPTNVVFENYKVEYTASTAGTTESNSSDWEYVGLTPYADGATGAKVSPSILTSNSSAKQTIKYWDTSATSYTFTAVSALDDDITGGHVKITKTESGSDVYDKGYSIVMDKDAHPENIYVADRVNKTDIATAKSQAVKMTFRNFQSKIRFGFYETVPGYYVQITGIKYMNSSTETSSTDKLIVNSSFYTKPDANSTATITYKVTYEDGTSTGEPTVNKARVVADGATAQDFLTFGGNIFGKNLETTSTSPTYDTDAKDNYTAILPNVGNSTNMTFKVSYKLISEDTGEEIAVTDRQVTVPAVYCQWKPNFSYTYLFKVSDQSAELYPITFDAVVAQDEYTGEQETITTVDDPSITTYVKGKVQTAYAANDIIYAFGEDGTTTAMSADNMKLYKVTTTDNFEITEASVKHALEQKGVTTKITAKEITSGDDAPTYVAIPREDNTTSRGITGMMWKAKTSTNYAIEFISGGNKYYKIVKIQ